MNIIIEPGVALEKPVELLSSYTRRTDKQAEVPRAVPTGEWIGGPLESKPSTTMEIMSEPSHEISATMVEII